MFFRSKILPLFVAIIVTVMLFSCDLGSDQDECELLIVKVNNSVEALGMVATKINDSLSIGNATIDDEYITIIFDDYGTAYINLSDDLNGSSIIIASLLKYTGASQPKIDIDSNTLEYISISRSIHGKPANSSSGTVAFAEYLHVNIDRSVDVKTLNGTWRGIFENGYLIEEYIFQDGVFTIKMNNNNFYQGNYSVTGKNIYLLRNSMWNGSQWLEMQETREVKRYSLELDLLKLKALSNEEENIYERLLE